MEFRSADAESRYREIVARAARTVVGLDFDGTLAPLVDDPERAHIHPGAAEVLADLATGVAAIAVITGRPARQVLALGGLEEVGDALAARGTTLHVFGQYGNERWSSTQRRIVSPRPPAGLASFERELPRTLRANDAAEAWVEDKGLAVAVHTRRMDDPDAAFERLLEPVRELAEENGLIVEPGRHVVEVRSAGMHKGLAVRRLVEETGAEGFVFGGDDLGDVEAFEALGALEDDGLAVLRLASASADGDNPLVPLADVVVDGPDGVLAFLARLAADARG
ncbi:trehalose-phosphatase [Nocardioides fonticola]|uniref:Trehalose 6-phosphate phosphatase n=1 Tax=Nocardioides fonticola TaxID=450363 RepID=A0ABP7XIJ8_9ACTN